MSWPKKIEDPDDGLQRINTLLFPLEMDQIEHANKPELPIVFIIGAPRSATTLVSQVLAKTGQFGYISNYSARFWLAPYIGLLQEFSLGIRNPKDIGFASHYGSTNSLIEPHEFTYFWDRWFTKKETHQMTPEELDNVEFETLLKELHAIESVYDLPLFFKNLRLSLYIKKLKQLIPHSKFVLCLRDPFYQAQSLLLGRTRKKKNIEEWYSIKPKEYNELKHKDPYQQVVGQIFFILRSISNQIEELPPNDFQLIYYENFVNQPTKDIKEIFKLINTKPSPNHLDKIPKKFINTNETKLEKSQVKNIGNSIDHFFKKSETKGVLAKYIEFYEL